MSVQDDRPSLRSDNGGSRKEAFSTDLDLCGQFLCKGQDCVAAPDSRAAADAALFRQLGNRNLLFERQRLPRVSNCSACVRFKFGEGRLGEARFVADITVGTAGCRGTLTACDVLTVRWISAVLREGNSSSVLRAGIPAVSQKGNWGPVGASWIPPAMC